MIIIIIIIIIKPPPGASFRPHARVFVSRKKEMVVGDKRMKNQRERMGSRMISLFVWVEKSFLDLEECSFF